MVEVAAGPTDSSTREKVSRCCPRASGEEGGKGPGRGGRLGFPKYAQVTVGTRKERVGCGQRNWPWEG